MPEFLAQNAGIDSATHPAGSLPKRIVLGAVLGIAAGIVLGDRAAILQPFGDAYGAMLQIAVFPYLLCTLMYSLGRLTPPMALRLLRAGWAPLCFFGS